MPKANDVLSKLPDYGELNPEAAKAVVAGTLFVAGLALPGLNVPLLAAGAAMAINVSAEQMASLTDRAVERWYANLFSDQGRINRDIAWALGEAFDLSIEQIKREWVNEKDYKHIERTDKDSAERTTKLLNILQTEIPKGIAHSDQKTLGGGAVDLYSDQGDPNTSFAQYLERVLDNYTYGYDENFVSFLSERLAIYFPERFRDVIHDSGNNSVRAWKEIQRLTTIYTTEIQQEILAIVGDTAEKMDKSIANDQRMLEIMASMEKTLETLKPSTPEVKVSYSKAMKLGTEAYFARDYDEAERYFAYCLQVAREIEVFELEVTPLEALASVKRMTGDYLGAAEHYIEIITRTAETIMQSSIYMRDTDRLLFSMQHFEFSAEYLKELYDLYLYDTLIFQGSTPFFGLQLAYGNEQIEAYLRNKPSDKKLLDKHLQMRGTILSVQPLIQNVLGQKFYSEMTKARRAELFLTKDDDHRLVKEINEKIWYMFNYDYTGEPEEAEEVRSEEESIADEDDLLDTIETFIAYVDLDGDQEIKANVLFNYGEILTIVKDLPKARRVLDEALELAKKLKDRRLIGLNLWKIGIVEIKEGNRERGRELLTQSLEVFRSFKRKPWYIKESIERVEWDLRDLDYEEES